MTAVEIFFYDLCHLGFIEYPDDSLVQDRFNLALEMEKEQIIDAATWGALQETGEKYYSETYKKDKP